MRRFLILAVVSLALGAAAFGYWPQGTNTEHPPYRTIAVERGNLIAAVRATGALAPVSTIFVSSQLSGQVVEILADFNDRVTEGQVIARLDSAQFRARNDVAKADLQQAEADLGLKRARVLRAEASLARARAAIEDTIAQRRRVDAQFNEAKRNVTRQKELLERKVSTTIALENAETQLQMQTAAVASAEAQILSARAEIQGLEADVALAKADVIAGEAVVAARTARLRDSAIDLSRTEIRAPVNGVIVQRAVEIGQTVVSTQTAATLFTVARDLAEMEISANVDESDVGRIREGQRVQFTVNAYPGRQFEGRVKQRRLGAQTIQNVVIYTVVISVRNADFALLPGMTASVQILTSERQNVLMVGNAALRWKPPGSPPAATPTAAAPPGLGQPSTPPQQGRAGGRQGQRASVEDMLATLDREVKPTPEERSAIEALLRDQRQRLRAAGLASLPRDEARERMRASRRELNAQVMKVLGEERRTAFEAFLARLAAAEQSSGVETTPGQIHQLTSDGKTRTIDVRLGVGDGVNTEIVAGEVEAGARIVIGGGPKAQGTAPAAPFSRFRIF